MGSCPCESSELSKPEMILSPLLTQRSKLTRLEMQMFPARAILMGKTPSLCLCQNIQNAFLRERTVTRALFYL